MGTDDTWTILVYMCGSDLESSMQCGTDDIKEMIAAKYSDKVNIVIQTGGTMCWHGFNINSTKTERYLVKEDNIEKLQTLPYSNMGNSDTLENFISFGVENYPAQHMGVIFWNHGAGSIGGACKDELKEDLLTLSEFEKAMTVGTKNMTDKFQFVSFFALQRLEFFVLGAY